MAAPTDFLRLYQELGLAPGASFDDLKRAYRRRVSELHPDRAGRSLSATLPGSAERLQQITQLYNAATLFHRQHGRLPGAVAPRPAGIDSRDTPVPRPPDIAPAPRRSRAPWFVLSLAAIAIWAFWSPPWSTPPMEDPAPSPAPPSRLAVPTDAAPATIGEAESEPAGNRHLTLHRGMPTDAVLELEGRPVTQSAERWDYGPSWIAFERDKVSDWYSSPLKPLKGASRFPPSGPVSENEEPLP